MCNHIKPIQFLCLTPYSHMESVSLSLSFSLCDTIKPEQTFCSTPAKKVCISIRNGRRLAVTFNRIKYLLQGEAHVFRHTLDMEMYLIVSNGFISPCSACRGASSAKWKRHHGGEQLPPQAGSDAKGDAQHRGTLWHRDQPCQWHAQWPRDATYR